MARAFGIVRNAWAWIVAEVEERAPVDHGGQFVPTVPTRGGACGNTESLVPQGMPHVPTVPTEKQGEVKLPKEKHAIRRELGSVYRDMQQGR